jgi:hypothetical protein
MAKYFRIANDAADKEYWPLPFAASVLGVEKNLLAAIVDDRDETRRIPSKLVNGEQLIHPDDLREWLGQRLYWLDYQKKDPDGPPFRILAIVGKLELEREAKGGEITIE